MRNSVKGSVIGCLVLLLAACASSPGSGELPPQVARQDIPVETYTIDVGDMVNINVWKNPDLSGSAPVRPDGKIAVPLIGDVVAAGRTPEDLAASIEGDLANYIKAPNVTVILSSLEGSAFLSRVRVTGAVEQNLSMNYHQGMTVLDAILEAGGVTVYADANRTRLHRRTESGTSTYNINLKGILEDGDMRSNVQLMPGDVLTVPERAF